MTTERQRAANRRNARKSTGPHSARGRAKVAQNALKHGLTLPPPSEDVLRWIRIILGDASATIDNLGGGAAREVVMALARAEARLERAQAAERDAVLALQKYTKTHAEPDPFALDLLDLEDPAVLATYLKSRHIGITKKGLRILISASDNRLPKLRKRLRLMERYVREAEREKRQAFAAWHEMFA